MAKNARGKSPATVDTRSGRGEETNYYYRMREMRTELKNEEKIDKKKKIKNKMGILLLDISDRGHRPIKSTAFNVEQSRNAQF